MKGWGFAYERLGFEALFAYERLGFAYERLGFAYERLGFELATTCFSMTCGALK